MQTNTCLRVNSTLAALALLSLAGLGASACMAEDDGPIELADLDLGAGIPEDALTGTARILTPDGELEVGYDIVSDGEMLRAASLRASKWTSTRSRPSMELSRAPKDSSWAENQATSYPLA